MDSGDDFWLGDRQEVIITLDIQMTIRKSFSSVDRFFEFDWMCVYSSKRARFGTIDETIESGSIDLHARRGGFWILRLGVIVRYDQVGGVDE